MTNMKQKSPSERTSRRKRYIDAIDPLRHRYNCSAKEVASLVNADLKKMESEVHTWKGTADSLSKEVNEHKEKSEELQTRVEFLEARWDRTVEVKQSLEQRLERQEREIEILKLQLKGMTDAAEDQPSVG